MAKKQKKVRPLRDLEVPAMVARGGKGPHKDHRKENKRKACREKVRDDD